MAFPTFTPEGNQDNTQQRAANGGALPMLAPKGEQQQPYQLEPSQPEPVKDLPNYQNWDYRNASTNPEGMTLPEGARGWNPDGTIDWGDGWQALAKEFSYNYNNSRDYIAGMVKQSLDTASPWDNVAVGAASLWEAAKLVGGVALKPFEIPARLTEQAGGALGYALQDMLYRKKGLLEIDWKANWNAGRVAYSDALRTAYGKGTIRDEFIRRVDSGEDPEDVETDMIIKGQANGWIEMGGRLLADPLNADLYLNWMGKGRQTLRMTKEAAKYFSEFEAAVPDFQKAVKAGNQSKIASLMDEAYQSMRKAAELTNEGVRALEKPGLLKNAAELPEHIRQWSKYIPEARRQGVINVTSMVYDGVVTMFGGDAVKVADTLTAWVNFMSDDEKISRAAFEVLMRTPNPSLFFSKAGNTTLAVTRALVERYGDNLVSILEKGDSVAETANQLIQISERVTADLFPSASEMFAAMVKEKELLAAGEEISDNVKRLASLGRQMSPVEKTVGRLHYFAQSHGVGLINTVLNKIYLGLSPAFAFRNMTQNYVQMFLDYGPRVFRNSETFGELTITTEKAATLLRGGVPLKAGGMEGVLGQGRVAKYTEKVSLWEAVKTSIKKLDSRAVSEAVENNAARMIVDRVFIDNFKNGLKPLVKSLREDKRFASLSADVWEKLEPAIYNNFGDADLAINSIRKGLEHGIFRDIEDINKLPKGVRDFIGSLGKDHEVIQNILTKPTLDAIIQNTESFWNEIDNMANEAFGEAMQLDTTDELELLLASGDLSDSRALYHAVVNRVNHEIMLNVDLATKTIDKVGGGAMKALTELKFNDPKKYEEIVTALGTDDIMSLIKEAQTKHGVEYLVGWSNRYPAITKKVEAAYKIARQTFHTEKDWDELMKLLEMDVPYAEAVKEYGSAKQAFFKIIPKYKGLEWDAQLADKMAGAKEFAKEVDKILEHLHMAIPDEATRAIDKANNLIQTYRSFAIGENGVLIHEGLRMGNASRSVEIASLAEKYGMSVFLKNGAPNDSYLLNVINKYGGYTFKSLDDPISVEMVNRAFAKKMGVNPISLDELRSFLNIDASKIEQVAELLKQPATGSIALMKPHAVNTPPSWLRALYESPRAQYKKLMLEDLAARFSDVTLVAKNADTERALVELGKVLKGRISELRATSTMVAEEARNFTLLNYPMKTYFDVASSYLFPYGFWYRGTYSNYLLRALYNPTIFAAYSKYKTNMAAIHANLPDWYKYQISTADFGINTDNPFYFNLEAALWPLNGMTGVDFNDPEKVTNWWTYGLQEIGKFGPSVWTPYQIATGLWLKENGQEEAGNHWLGRGIPQTALVKNLTGVEFDPFVKYLEGGYTWDERNRIGRALYDLQGKYTMEQLIDAAQTQSGPIWEEAARLSQQKRAVPQTLATLFGVGYKARSTRDLQIDEAYAAFRTVMERRDEMDADTFRESMAQLSEKYPFMEYVLLSKKAGEARDIAYAYNVLSRIPPGDINRVLAEVGIDDSRINLFFENKGNMSGWGQGERDQFMGGIAMLASILKMPSSALKQEWSQAKSLYRDAEKLVSEQLGFKYTKDNPRGIWDRVQEYYDALENDPKAAEALKQMYPIQEALDAKRAYISNTPELFKYYGSLDTLEAYYQGRARSAMISRFGENIYDLSADYSILSERARLKIPGAAEEFAKFKKQHLSTLKEFWAEKDAWEQWVNEAVIKVGSKMPEQPPLEFRPNENPTDTQAGLMQSINQPQTVTAEEILASKNMRPEIVEIIKLWLSTGQEMPSVATRRIGFAAQEFGLTPEELLQILGVYFTQTP